MKRRPSDWPIAKCKRTVRPLIAKIHSLNELYTSYPSIIEFDVDSFEKHYRRPGSGAAAAAAAPAAAYPKGSSERLNHLKPFVSPELYQAYQEMLHIFKTIVMQTIAPDGAGTVGNSAASSARSSRSSPGVASLAAPAKLSVLCCYKIGQSMSLYSRSSHYKLNNSLLFDKQPPRGGVESEFEDDIDSWLEMDPVQIIAPHRPDLVVGYAIHLLVLHSNLSLYALVPVLVEWLYEQSRARGYGGCAAIGRTLFHEFWYNNDEYDDANGTSNKIFWLFLRCGYWEHFVAQLDLQSSYSTAASTSASGAFASLVLDTLPLNNKFATRGSAHHMPSSSLYSLIQQAPQHFQVNSVLIYTLGKLIRTIRQDLRKCRAPEETETALNFFLDTSLRDFLRLWLGCTDATGTGVDGMVFNSLLPGNAELFDALHKILNYCLKTAQKLRLYLNARSVQSKAETACEAVRVLRWYFLLEPPSGASLASPAHAARVGGFISSIQNTRDRTVRNADYDEFLAWAAATSGLAGLAKVCLDGYYKRLDAKELDRLHWDLFGEYPSGEAVEGDADDDAGDDSDMFDESYI